MNQDGKFIISKGLNPDTNKESSRATTDFSFTIWGEITDDYFVSIKKLDRKQFESIFNMAFSLTRHSGKYKPTSKSTTDGRSNRADLQSDSDSDKNDGDNEGTDKDVDKTGENESDEYYTGPIDNGYNEW